MPKHEGAVVHAEILVDAPPLAAWEAWALPEWISQWYVDRADDALGHGTTVRWGFEHYGELEIETFEAVPGESLLFGGSWPGWPKALHEVRFTEEEGGATRVAISYSGVPDGPLHVEILHGVISGWEMALAQFKHWIEHHAEAQRTHLLSIRPARFEYADLQPFLKTGAGLTSWLASEASLKADPLEAGDEVQLMLRDDGLLSGRVLAITEREVLLEWREAGAVLGLKCYGGGPDHRRIALDFSAWALAEVDRAPAQAILDAAAERLLQSIA